MKANSDQNILLSICITSYNRPYELIRCLESIDITKKSTVEIIVSEDCSPKSKEINELVNNFISQNEYKVIYNTNIKNLGYDRNLGKLIELSNGQYVLLMSDDDIFIKGALDLILERLERKDISVAFSPFQISSENEYRREYNKEFHINPSISNAAKYLYSSILFSGLIFDRNKILMYKSEKFLNLMYFQVYLFCNTIYKYGGTYIDIPLVDCIGDGENAFGISESSLKNDLLANRQSIYSNLEYHKGLIEVLKIFDKENNTKIIDSFSKEYSIRSYTGLKSARSKSVRDLKGYWEIMSSLDLNINYIARIYYIMLLIFGTKISNTLISIPKKCYQIIGRTKKRIY